MSELTKLREDHARLAKLFNRLSAMVARPTPVDVIDLFDLRRDLVTTLLSHLKLEDWSLYPRLIDSGDPEASSAGRAFKEEMGGLAPEFVAYTHKWHASAIQDDWAGYCADTRAILAALTNRVTRENRELLPLLERLAHAA